MKSSGCRKGRQLLREWLDRSRLNQKEAAERIGMKATHLSEILGGARRPGLELAVRIERCTGVVAEAWVGTSEGDAAQDIQSRGADDA